MSIRSTGAVGSGRRRSNMPGPKEKSFAIPRLMVWEAWRQVKANKGAPGVDEVDLEEFEADLRDNLYKIWNRMSSGSYFPPAVRAVESECWACQRSRTGSRRRSWPCIWRNGRTIGFARTPMATGRADRPMTRSRHVGSGAGRTTG